MKIFERYEGDDERYAIPGEYEAIGDQAFYDTSELQELTMSDGVTAIGDYAFKLCYRLESVWLPERVKHFGVGVFQQCHRLKRAFLPEGVTLIDAGMFLSCWDLEELWIPDTIREIDGSAFAVCRSLRTIHIASSVFGVLPESVRTRAAISYMCDHYRENVSREKTRLGAGAVQANSEDDPVHGYIREHLGEVVDQISEEDDTLALRYLTERCELTGLEQAELLDRLMDHRKADLVAILLESKQRADRTSPWSDLRPEPVDPFDWNPFA